MHIDPLDCDIHNVSTYKHMYIHICIYTYCNTLQHTATHCNTLQHTATHMICHMS